MSLRIVLLSALLSIISACASFNDAMTPSLSMTKDQFDGAIILEQPLVSSSSSLSEGWHSLGFQWYEKQPEVVFIEVGVPGITNITGAVFNVDGEIIDSVKEASKLTSYGDVSSRRLVMPINDFVKIAQGKNVKMKVLQIDTYSVSSFGSENTGAIINSKFQPFIEKLKAHGAL